jgi:TRAP-type C4-dicarboxylate transport system substrate-binding protein
MVTMNLDAWKGLSPELQKAVLDAAQATSERQWKEIQNRVAVNDDRMRANGVGITTEVPPAFLEALAKAGQVPIDEWVARAGPSGQEILDTYRKRRGDGGR